MISFRPTEDILVRLDEIKANLGFKSRTELILFVLKHAFYSETELAALQYRDSLKKFNAAKDVLDQLSSVDAEPRQAMIKEYAKRRY